jgi:predicted glycoside hydrolase/deacetylase ChbG (UPF0249 family)
MASLMRVPGARPKRAILSAFGQIAGQRSKADGFPHCPQFAGLTDPPYVADQRFFVRWLRAIPGERVELMCHPGYRDETLIGRDCAADNEFVARRVHELALLRAPEFLAAVKDAGFRLTAPSAVVGPGLLRRAVA